MGYAPAMPLSGFAPPPDPKVHMTMTNFISKVLPPLNVADLQLSALSILSSVKSSQLGQYNKKNIGASSFFGVFGNRRIRTALTEFQAKIEKIDAEIKARNKLEVARHLPPYDYLRVKNIPQSINI